MNLSTGNQKVSRLKKKAKPKDFKKTFKRVFMYFKKDKKITRLIFLLVIIDSIISTIIPYTLGKVVDIINIDIYSKSIFLKGILILLLFYIIEFLVKLFKGIFTARLSQSIVRDMRSNLFLKFRNLPITFFDKSPTGDIMSRVTNDVDNISTGISTSLVQLITGILNILLTFIMMFILSPILTFCSIVLIPIVMFLSNFIAKRTRVFFKQQQVELGKLNSHIEEMISNINVVKAFNYEKKSVGDFKAINDRLLSISLKSQIYTSLLMPIMNVISNIGFAIICIIGGVLASKDVITIGVIASFLSYVRQFTRPLNELANLFNTLLSAVAGCERVFEVMDEQEEEQINSNTKSDIYNNKNNNLKKSFINGDIEFKDVSFSYDSKKNILSDINLKIKAGTSNAIIGETGSGKTTIINLITNFYQVEKGKIFLDGNDIYSVDRNCLRNYFGVVPQESYIFNDTVMENIRYGNLTATDEQVISASKIANLHKFIIKMHGGYETVLSDRGEDLSEGQKQLISIARAVLKNAPILILDEATSNIDIATEAKIQDAINNVTYGKTSIIIAHRLSTISNCNNIIVLENGRIVESGNHKELMKLKGHYYRNILLTNRN
ncbi:MULTISPECIES: ABC transporter ATP-binding protein [unclassified Clostridioides]|uniref:ABC transporter ATP-binding protein n=1 Tax=unclassified Clostridioides TaxID=2635829 RepID=UPI001D0C411A|nr:ABC transporter ATP-binding protein [Clostridioides sp. ES-S-0001-02]MCC0657776.1 ABC transporter ATP-binding protein [Clostridioides sp. ES-S-0123-01]MCC0673371.1 ABC transporter ATP-binding protein [Clostridioides sp. ES-S-0145-01]MCC0679052.1 ABC transporter ATP-binding protein [Clostridioides sp. ES-S-0005-03]MCC0694352.1 ABC transporter ATP-binding protein [Clostridioides sp. ES-S-0048-02]MCC0761854.1 ABC transporter ATP-binding protein [Clostridioides sp. ES-S-0006-03]UDN48860.1 ABC 